MDIHIQLFFSFSTLFTLSYVYVYYISASINNTHIYNIQLLGFFREISDYSRYRYMHVESNIANCLELRNTMIVEPYFIRPIRNYIQFPKLFMFVCVVRGILQGSLYLCYLDMR